MPRLSSLRISALEDLANQLRFAPKERILEQVSRVEEVARLIDPEQNYPEDWFIFRVTGYRPELDAPAIFAGEALLGDLSALTERLTEGAALSIDDLGAGALHLEQLQEVWEVSARTIARQRRRGLIACRVVEADGARRLAFRRAAIELFERRPETAIRLAPPIDRIPPDDRRRLYLVGVRAARRFNWSLNETAARLAQRTGRSQETLRQLLRQHDLREALPVFTDTGPLTPRQRQFAHRAWRRGAEPHDIGQRLGRSRATIHRVINERRAAVLRRESIGTSFGASFDADDDVSRLLDHPSVRNELTLAPVDDVASLRRIVSETPAPNVVVERAWGRAHAALLQRAGHAIGDLRRSAPSSEALDQIETDLRWATLLRGMMVQSQWRLIASAIEGRSAATLDELPRQSMKLVYPAVLRAAVDAACEFDPFGSGRLAAPTGLAVNRSLASLDDLLVRDSGKARSIARLESLPDWRRGLAGWQRWVDPDPRLRAFVRDEGDSNSKAIAVRYGWLGEPPRTLAEIEREFDLRRAAYLALEREALHRMRERATDGCSR